MLSTCYSMRYRYVRKNNFYISYNLVTMFFVYKLQYRYVEIVATFTGIAVHQVLIWLQLLSLYRMSIYLLVVLLKFLKLR